MEVTLDKIEERITEFWTNIFRNLLFFLNDNHQSLCVSFLHYFIFIIGFYFFFFKSQPRSIFRIVFFFFMLLGTISYFIFNKCFITSIELSLCSKKNRIQAFMDKYFGRKIEGNLTSKTVLSLGLVITGLILANDYGIIKYNDIRNV